MQLPQASHLASQLALLLPLAALCATVQAPHEVDISASPRVVRDESHRIHPSLQPFATQPITRTLAAANTTVPPPTPHTLLFLDFHAIVASPQASTGMFRAFERLCEVFAYALLLLDLDLLEARELVLHVGDFTLEFYDVVEHLSMLAVKAVVLKLIRMISKGLLGFVTGEMVDAQAGVKMIFAFGVWEGGYEEWRLRKRSKMVEGRTQYFHI